MAFFVLTDPLLLLICCLVVVVHEHACITQHFQPETSQTAPNTFSSCLMAKPTQPFTSLQFPNSWKITSILLRALVTCCSLAALIFMAKDKEREPIPGITQVARPSDVTAFIYLIYTNGAAAIYCFLVALVLVASLAVNIGNYTLAWALFILDQSITYLLLGVAAASTEVAVIAKKGDDKVFWSELCSEVGHFCRVGEISLILTFVSVVALIILSDMSAYHLFKRYSSPPSPAAA